MFNTLLLLASKSVTIGSLVTQKLCKAFLLAASIQFLRLKITYPHHLIRSLPVFSLIWLKAGIPINNHLQSQLYLHIIIPAANENVRQCAPKWAGMFGLLILVAN
jgi:hypothetical protein